MDLSATQLYEAYDRVVTIGFKVRGFILSEGYL